MVERALLHLSGLSWLYPIDSVVRALAADAGLDISAHLLRHTCLTNLVRGGADVVLVAELAGHRRLDTTRRYSLPSEADRDAAVEALLER
ncbi:MAG: site-specific integrase [Acidimicrobiales bacterium]